MSRTLSPVHQAEFEADCRAARERAYALIAASARPAVRTKRKPTPDGQADQPNEDRVIIRRSNAKLYTLDGKSRTLSEWSAMCGHSVPLLYSRMKSGMTFEQAVTTPKLKSSVPWKDQVAPSAEPGVVQNFAPSMGTGAGSTTQDFP